MIAKLRTYFQFYVPPNILKQYSWWVDRYGEKQYFLSGKFIDGAEPSERHICQCGIDQNCEDDNYLCNCDIVTSVGTQRKTDFGMCNLYDNPQLIQI